MREEFVQFMNGFLKAKEEPFANNQFGVLVRETLPKSIYKTGVVDSQKYLVTGSIGQGSWAMIPWVCIFDRTLTTSALRGVYIVYLLSKEGDRLYLTLNQGCTDIRKNHTKSETIGILRENAYKITSTINTKDFEVNDRVFLGNNLTERGELYQSGTIVYKEYKKSHIPTEKELRDDLKKMLEVYNSYSLSFETSVMQKNEKEILGNGIINYIKSFIASRGFSYPGNLIENFYLSLKSKPFAILAGTSGTGKTRLVKLFAEAIGANEANGRYKMVSVRPDWSDGSDLFGHTDLNGKFINGPVCSAFEAAAKEPDKPVFLCLDEMNLARVEYYLSDFLSVIESREKGENGRIMTSAIAQYKGGIPDNLYIVGTVNMDETTFPFSKKVLDRANTIEFNYVELVPSFEQPVDSVQSLQVPNSFLRTEYLVLERDCADERDYVVQICDKLQAVNEILRKANAHVGYRVRDEIVFYMLNNKKADNLLTEEQAFDNEIMQKILPRIQGSSVAIKDMLVELFKFCMGSQSGPDTESGKAGEQMQSMAESAIYKESAMKIGYMMKRYEEDGFTSYWL